MALVHDTLNLAVTIARNLAGLVWDADLSGHVAVLVICIGAVLSFPWKDAQARKRLLILLAFPALWALMIVWGGAFAYHHEEGPPDISGWVTQIHAVVMYAAFFAPFLFIAFLKGARLFTCFFAIANTVVTFTTGLLSACAIGGACL